MAFPAKSTVPRDLLETMVDDRGGEPGADFLEDSWTGRRPRLGAHVVLEPGDGMRRWVLELGLQADVRDGGRRR